MVCFWGEESGEGAVELRSLFDPSSWLSLSKACVYSVCIVLVMESTFPSLEEREIINFVKL